MTNRYFFHGVVLPERAQLSHGISLDFSHIASGVSGKANISIILNQVAVTVESPNEWDIFDLRNVVVNLVRSQLDAIGYLVGHAYELEITRVVNHELSVDQVFGIDMPCIAGRERSGELGESFTELLPKLQGSRGVLLKRCFADLASAMRNADDTAFYCYRALESLRHHCASTHGLSDAIKQLQWDKFREVLAIEKGVIDPIRVAAEATRHGEAVAVTGTERVELLTATWRIVDSYIAQVDAND